MIMGAYGAYYASFHQTTTTSLAIYDVSSSPQDLRQSNILGRYRFHVEAIEFVQKRPRHRPGHAVLTPVVFARIGFHSAKV